MAGKKQSNRFQVILEESIALASGSKILQDKETGVLYYFHYSGYAGGLTALIGQDGKPLVGTKPIVK